MTGLVFRFADVKDYPPTWRAIVTFLAHTPNRRFTAGEICDFVYRNDPNGGPLNAVNLVTVHVHRHRHRVPEGWRLSSQMTDGVNGYAMVATDAPKPRLTHAEMVSA